MKPSESRNHERTRERWQDMLAEVRAERRKAPADGYTHRVVMLSVEDECDAGGVPVVTFSIEPEELSDILEILAIKERVDDWRDAYSKLTLESAKASSETEKHEAVTILRDIYDRGLIDGFAQTHDRVSKFLKSLHERPGEVR